MIIMPFTFHQAWSVGTFIFDSSWQLYDYNATHQAWSVGTIQSLHRGFLFLHLRLLPGECSTYNHIIWPSSYHHHYIIISSSYHHQNIIISSSPIVPPQLVSTEPRTQVFIRLIKPSLFCPSVERQIWNEQQHWEQMHILSFIIYSDEGWRSRRSGGSDWFWLQALEVKLRHSFVIWHLTHKIYLRISLKQ